jgi:D-glycero-beta-D-manno-heptose-7-phosphate kinase
MIITTERARELLARFAKQRVLVVGDLMLDRYVYGEVNRISPEAPVPVVRVSRETSMPGGAANVAWNINALGARASVGGVLGRDHAALALKQLLGRGRISTAGVLTVGGLTTTQKMRIVAERQQVVRVDWEGRPHLSRSAIGRYRRLLAREVRRSTAVIIEDYSKGVVNQRVVDTILREAGKAGIPVGLDPKFNREITFSGLTVATPNRKEAYFTAGLPESPPHENPLKDKPLLNVGRKLLKLWSPRLLMITLGAQGMLLMAPGEPTKHVPTRARAVFDVSGAGDTAIATCLLALAAGAAPVEAAELANYAAGVVCGKPGTATCNREELLNHME